MSQVFVTGMGIVSALGTGCEEHLFRLRAGETGIGKPAFLNSRYASSHVFGEVNKSTETLMQGLGFTEADGLTRTDLLALLAFEEAVSCAGLTAEEISEPRTAFISGSTVGGMCLTEQIYADSNLQGEGSPYLSAYACGAHTLRIAGMKKIKGFTTTFNTACSSSANAIMLGARMIKAGSIDRAIVGGTDALAKFTINGFNSLQILSEQPCKPFDETRTGLNLGEGAAYLVLESEACSKNKTRYAEVAGYGNSNDAFHPSALSEEALGVTTCIQAALKTAGIQGVQIDYINAHGTATPNNDLTELTGIKHSLGRIPLYNSTKPYTGHTLGAAGAIEAIFSIFSILHREIYPGLNCTKPITAFPEAPVREYLQGVPIRYVLSNSFGFAGSCTSLILAKTT